MFSEKISSNLFSQRMPELDGMRGFGLLMVIYYHYGGCMNSQWVVGHFFQRTSIMFSVAVDLFFLLSGFLLGGTLMEKRMAENYYRVYFIRRILRIIPVYFLLLASYVFFRLLESPSFNSKAITGESFPLWPYVFFLQNIFIAIKGSFDNHYLAVTWSLALEEQFCLILPWVIRKFSPQNLPKFLVFLILSSPLLRIIFAIIDPYKMGLGAAFFLAPCRFDIFALGVLMAYLLKNTSLLEWTRQNLSWVYGYFFIFFIMWGVFTLRYEKITDGEMLSFRLTSMAFFCALTFLLSLAHPSGLGAFFRFPIFCHFGKLSYFMYLFHFPFLFITHIVIFRQKTVFIHDAATLGITLFSFIVLWIAALFSWEFFEKRLIAIGHRFQYSLPRAEK